MATGFLIGFMAGCFVPLVIFVFATRSASTYAEESIKPESQQAKWWRDLVADAKGREHAEMLKKARP